MTPLIAFKNRYGFDPLSKDETGKPDYYATLCTDLDQDGELTENYGKYVILHADAEIAGNTGSPIYISAEEVGEIGIDIWNG